MPSNDDPSPLLEASSHSTSDTLAIVMRRRPIPRKGHRKSRAGCAICKRRKVKCDEVSPECGPCLRLGLRCQFTPTTTTPQAGNETNPSSTVSLRQPLHSELPTFRVEDLRFFQHFLFNAYPSLPIGGWEVWQEVGQMAHEYDFLAHSMLGLGASHLGLLSGVDHGQSALKHRVTSISSLNSHLQKPNLSMADADAAFGAMLSLTFQAAYMPDGMTDFFTMVRGCFIVGSTLIGDLDTSKFRSFARAAYVDKVRALICSNEADPSLDSVVTEAFCDSLKRLAPVCRSVAELEYLSKMHRIASLAVTDPAECYREHSFLYDKLGELSPEEFSSFLDPQNYASQLIIAHLLALDFVMSRKDVQDGSQLPSSEGQQRGFDCRKAMSVTWIFKILNDLPEEYKEYASWVAEFSKDLTFSFEKEADTWRPFLLHNGRANIPNIHHHRQIEQDGV